MNHFVHNACQLCRHMVDAMKPVFSLRFSPKGRCVGTGNASRKWAFCVSGVTTTLDSSLVSAGCGVKTNSKAGVSPLPSNGYTALAFVP